MILRITGSKDNTIQNNSLSQSFNVGLCNNFWIMRESSSNSVARSLVGFDWTDFNSKQTNEVFLSSQISSSYLYLYTAPVTSSVSIVDETLQFNLILTSWIEGSSSCDGGKAKASNWLSCSEGTTWTSAGACADTGSVAADYVTTTKIFDDIKLLISSSWLANLSSSTYDGVLIRYTNTEESGSTDYWKTFYSRHSYNKLKVPAIYVFVDDDIQDNRNNVRVNTASALYLYNYNNENNLINATGIVTCSVYGFNPSGSSGSVLITSGSASLLKTGVYSYSLTATGTYGSSSVYDIWKDASGNLLGGFTSSIYNNQVSSGKDNFYNTYLPYSYRVFTDMPDIINYNDIRTVRVYMYQTLNNFTRTGSLQQQYIPSEVYYNVVDNETGKVIFDYNNATRMSRDRSGSYFAYCFDSIPANREYKFNYKIVENNKNIIMEGPVFRTKYNDML